MNGKFMLLAMLSINFILLGYASIATNQSLFSTSNSPVYSIYSFTSNQTIGTAQTQPTFVSGVSSALTSMLTPVSGGITLFAGIQTFIDVIALILAFLAILTPLPFLAFVYSFGLPAMFNILIFAPVIILYAVSMMEFIRGGSF